MHTYIGQQSVREIRIGARMRKERTVNMTSELVKGLRKLANQWKHNDVAGFNLIFDACDTIEALSAKVRDADRPTWWIPVSERLPGKNGCYLVSTTGENNDIIDMAYYIEGMWHKASRIKAWMPLPEPYKGGDTE